MRYVANFAVPGPPQGGSMFSRVTSHKSRITAFLIVSMIIRIQA